MGDINSVKKQLLELSEIIQDDSKIAQQLQPVVARLLQQLKQNNELVKSVEELRKVDEEHFELFEQKDFFLEIFNTIPTDLVVFNKKHEYLFINPRAIRNPEIREWMIGKTDYDYCEFRNLPVEIADSRRAIFNYVVETKKHHDVEDQRIVNGKREVILRRFLPVFSENGELKYVIGYGLDISERKDAEDEILNSKKQLELVIKASNDGFWDWNVEENQHYFSESLLSILNVEVNDLPQDANHNILVDYLSEIERELFLSDLKRLTEGKITTSENVFTFNVKGNNKYIKTRIISLLGPKGMVSRIIASLSDITPIVKSQLELQKAIEKAEEVYKFKANFMANLSHEIRTPLNGVIGLSQVIENEYKNVEGLGDYTKLLQESAKRLLSTINGIIELSNLESKSVIENLAVINVNQTIQKVGELYADKAKRRGLEFIVHLNLDELNVRIDPAILLKILSILTDNAIKFTQEGKVVITSFITDHKYVLVEVKDTGIGISNQFKQFIFEPFKQESEGFGRDFEGTGIGLALAKKFAELFGGTVYFESEKNVGSSFYLKLPFNN